MSATTIHLRQILFLLCALCGLSGCGQVEPVRNAKQLHAVEYGQRALRAFQLGNYETAENLYQQALRRDVEIENIDGIAVNTLNLARVNRILGRTARAHAYLDALLQDDALQYAPVYLATAATEKAALYLQANDLAAAESWLGKAEASCGDDCPLRGVIANIRSAIVLGNGDAVSSLAWGERAAAANRNTSRLEYANSLRLLAAANLALGHFENARSQLNEALDLDKSLGLPLKIREDLLLLARLHDALGQPQQAKRYQERAARLLPAP